jgi:hypothetical protein
MAKGIALAVGLNAVDPNLYSGWTGELGACESDANDMAEIVKTKGFVITTLLTKAVTRASLTAEVTKAANTLIAGDIFVMSYSGHGGQLPDLNGDEPDDLDETWCLYDGQLVDDEIYWLLSQFKPQVRIVIFSDSCHSGTVAKMAYYRASVSMGALSVSPPEIRYRFMPREVEQRTYRDNKVMYDPILSDPKLKQAQNEVKAHTILISGCQDNQFAADGPFNGLFTGTLLQVWNHGTFKGNYRDFHCSIVNRMPPNQTPNYFVIGQPNRTFEMQTPFSI